MVIKCSLDLGDDCNRLVSNGWCSVNTGICYNGGSCYCARDGTKCSCFNGYAGKYCEIPPGIYSIPCLPFSGRHFTIY